MKTFLYYCIILCLTVMVQTAHTVPIAIDLEVTNGESGIYVLFSDGRLQTAGTVINRGFPANINAVDFTLTNSERGYYILDENGTIYTYGDAVLYGRPFSSTSRYVDFELTQTGTGYYLSLIHI